MSTSLFNHRSLEKFMDEFDSADLLWTSKEIEEEKVRQQEFDKKCRKAVLKADKIRRKRELKEISNRYSRPRIKREFDLSTTTKQVFAYITLLCTSVIIYSMVAMWKFQDLSSLPSLIAAVVTEGVCFLTYCAKSYLETKAEKSHEIDMMRLSNNTAINNDEDIINN